MSELDTPEYSLTGLSNLRALRVTVLGKARRSFFRYLLYGFLLTALLSVWVIQTTTPSSKVRLAKELLLASGVSSSLLNESINFGATRAFREWWIYRLGMLEEGVAVRLTQSEEGIGGLFPGYEKSGLRDDHALWADYFSQSFDATVLSEPLGASQGLNVAIPWLGCLSIYSRHGGDSLIIGNSETYMGLVVGLLAHPGELGPLYCTRSSLQMEVVPELLQAINQSRRIGQAKLKRILIGVSSEWTYEKHDDSQTLIRQQRNELAAYHEKNEWWTQLGLAPWLEVKGKALVQTPSWETLAPFHFEDWRHPKKGSSVPTLFLHNGIVVSRTDRPRLNELVAQNASHYEGLNRIPAEACREADSFRHKLGEVIQSALAVAERVYLYVPPVLPFQTAQFDPCVFPMLKKTLAFYSSDRVRVKSADWHDYGLEWEDFLAPRMNHTFWLDLNHTNQNGARKVSLALQSWINEQEKSPL